jgi:hypothetical protein
VHAVRNLDLSLVPTQNCVDSTNVLAVHDGMHRGALTMQRPPTPAELLTSLINAGLLSARP